MKTKSILLYLLLSAMVSCNDDILDENPQSVLNPVGFYSEEEGLVAGVNSAYANLRDIYGQNEEIFRMTLLGTDLFTHGKAELGLNFNNYDSDLNPFTGEIQLLWTTCYKVINVSNNIIVNAPDVDINETKKMQLVGEALFLRALSYFWLVQQFGDVPLRLEPTEGVVTEASRAPASEVYNAIIDDLTLAIQNLDPSSQDWGRARKGAAQHLLSKVYLNLKEWDKAATLAKAVIQDPNYSLVENFSDIFSHENQMNPEIIFSVQYENDPVNSGNIGNRTHLYFQNSYSDIPGMARDLRWGRPWSRFAPTSYLMGLMDEYKDERSDIWRKFEAYFYNNASTLPEGKNLGDPVDPSWKNTIEFHPALLKYWDPTRSQVNEPRGNKDFIVFRLGETYLIAAEALMMSGNTGEAVTYFNTLRQRAARPGVDFSITASELNIDMILDERGRELAGEMHRWSDLVRTGKALDRVKAYSANGQNIQEHQLLRPIPQNEIDLLTVPMEQNPGY